MVPKSKLLNKYIMYMNDQGKFCQGKVVKIVGRTLTIMDAYKEKHRIHPNTIHIYGVFKTTKIKFKKMSEYLEEIKW